MTSTTFREATRGAEARAEIFREATVMVLYVSVIEIAELAAMPQEHFPDGHVTGMVGGDLLMLLWGTAIGLAVAHLFAFRLAAPAFREERITKLDAVVSVAQIAGAAFVAAVSSLPVLFFSDVRAQEFTGGVPALIVGVVGYLVARATGRSKLAAVFYGITALAVGVLVAIVKSMLAAH